MRKHFKWIVSILLALIVLIAAIIVFAPPTLHLTLVNSSSCSWSDVHFLVDKTRIEVGELKKGGKSRAKLTFSQSRLIRSSCTGLPVIQIAS